MIKIICQYFYILLAVNIDCGDLARDYMSKSPQSSGDWRTWDPNHNGEGKGRAKNKGVAKWLPRSRSSMEW